MYESSRTLCGVAPEMRIETTCQACGGSAVSTCPPQLCADCLAAIESVFSDPCHEYRCVAVAPCGDVYFDSGWLTLPDPKDLN